MPEINIDIMSRSLEYLGYAPLDPDIRQKSGAHTDHLFLWVLEQFEKYRSYDPEADRQSQKMMLRCVDEQVVKYLSSCPNSTSEDKKIRKQFQDLRIMKFRSLGEMK